MRYIPLIEASAERQMAIDESILRSFDEGNCDPTFRFFRFKPSAITLGYTQSIEETIDVKRCEEENIPFVRRMTGGGTVFHDYDGEITYSMVTKKAEKDIEESFRKNLQPVINTLKRFGLDATFKPYNDILVGTKKISGSAQRRGKEGFLQHGTLMYATDLEKLSEILKVDEEKLKEKGADSFLDLVTTVEKETGEKPGLEEIIDSMKEEYVKHFQEEVEEEGLSEEEKERTSKLESKYSSDSWTHEREWK
ncbi:MAG: lipoate--protein ligase family protein [Candidatus Thermoplasmatota archaeon]|nr:lipoate--protein ligase family protein [Candidatus Thermoplasmatota archaeon]